MSTAASPQNHSNVQQEVIYFQTLVVGIEQINAQISRVKFKGVFPYTTFSMGDFIGVKTLHGNYQNYLPASIDVKKGRCELICYKQERESDLLFALGEPVEMAYRKNGMVLESCEQLHFLFGDESSLGFFSCMLANTETMRQQYIGVLEVDRENLVVPLLLGIDVVTVPKARHGIGSEFAVEWVKGLGLFMIERLKHASFYLIGSAASLRHFTATLFSMGIENNQIKACMSVQDK